MSGWERFWHEVAEWVDRHLAHHRHRRRHHHKLKYITGTLTKAC